MGQTKVQAKPKLEVSRISIKWENQENKPGFSNTAYNILHLVFVTTLIACLTDLLVNGNLVLAFEDIGRHFNAAGLKLDFLISYLLWISLVVLIMEAALHARICFDLFRWKHNHGNQQRMSILFDLSYVWFQATLLFILVDGLVFLRISEFYLSHQVLTLLMSHMCSSLVVCSYTKRLQIASYCSYQEELLDIDGNPSSIVILNP